MIPDLPVDEASAFAEACAERGVGFCPLVAPTSSDERLEEAGALATGFVYCVSVAGVTGVRDGLPPKAVELLRRVRPKTEAPVALGFGIGSPEAAAEAAAEADGVIIGSKLMRLVGEGGAEEAGAWLRGVREALSGGREGWGYARSETGLASGGSTPGAPPRPRAASGPMDAVFTKCERCGQPIYEKDLAARFNVCPHCEFHYPLPAPERVRLLTDRGYFEEHDRGMIGRRPSWLRGLRGAARRRRARRRASTTPS